MLNGFGDFANCSAWKREALIGITTEEMFQHYLQTYRTERDEHDSIPEEDRLWNPIVNKGDEDGDPEDRRTGNWEIPSVFRICDANVQGLDVQEAHIRARSKSERAPMKTFMYVQNLELRACTPLVPGIFWPRKIQNFGAPGMNAGVRPKHERIRTNTFTYVQVLDVHGKY